VVAFASGRIDALVFMLGLVAGTFGFAGVYEKLAGFMESGKGPDGQTLPQWLGLPEPAVLAILLAVAIAGFIFGGRMERSSKGPLSAEETLGIEPPSR
jgi:hypothetical protein